ncbi:MAG: HEAT repeat domain-containing protein [Bdellovibrionia bacterium]
MHQRLLKTASKLGTGSRRILSKNKVEPSNPLRSESIEESLVDPDPKVRKIAENAFFKLPEESVVKITEEIFKRGPPHSERMSDLLAQYPHENIGKVFSQLLENPSRAVNAPGMIALLFYRGKYHDSVLNTLMQSPNVEVRTKAIKSLEKFANESNQAEQHFKTGLTDPNPKVNEKTVQALKNLQMSDPKKSAHLFINLLQNPDAKIAGGAQEALTKFIGEDPVSMFHEIFNTSFPRSREKLTPVIMKYSGFNPELIYTAAFTNSNFSGKTQEKMLTCYEEGCTELFKNIILVNQYTDEEKAFIKSNAKAYAGEPKYYAALSDKDKARIDDIKNKKTKVQSYMRYILQDRSGPGAKAMFHEFLMDPRLNSIAAEGLKGSARTAVPKVINRKVDELFRKHLIESLLDEKDNPSQVRIPVAAALGSTKLINPHLTFKKAFLDSDPKVLENAKTSLKNLSAYGIGESIQVFKNLLTDQDPKISKIAASALKHFEGSHKAEIFKGLLDDRDPSVQAAAMEAYKGHGDKDAEVKAMIAWLKEMNRNLLVRWTFGSNASLGSKGTSDSRGSLNLCGDPITSKNHQKVEDD